MKTSFALMLFTSLALAMMTVNCEKVDGSNYETSTTPSPKPEDIPNSWKSIDTGKFLFSLPPEMKQKKVQGIDSQVWQFDSKDISFAIEAGMYTSDFTFEGDRYESSMQKVIIGGLNGDRIVLDLNKPK